MRTKDKATIARWTDLCDQLTAGSRVRVTLNDAQTFGGTISFAPQKPAPIADAEVESPNVTIDSDAGVRTVIGVWQITGIEAFP